MANVGKQIKKLRTARSMTQDELAEQLFVSRQTVSNYETGKSNPDIDMLVNIAQVFGTDVNCLIYGPPVPPDRKRDRRRAVILAAVTGALAVTIALMAVWAEALRERYIIGPSLVNFYGLWPVLMLTAGWTVMELAGLLGAKRPRGAALRYIRWLLIGLLAFYGVMAVPFLVWTGWCSLSVIRNGGVSSSFSFPLGFMNHLWNRYFPQHPSLFRAGFALMGAGLWLTRREKRQEPENPSEP